MYSNTHDYMILFQVWDNTDLPHIYNIFKYNLMCISDFQVKWDNRLDPIDCRSFQYSSLMLLYFEVHFISHT